ncbi:MAG: putative 2OG-Fe(II) oxygenase [Bdellovibrionales bacterium]
MNLIPLFSTPFLHTKMPEEIRLNKLNFLFSNFDFSNISAEYNDYNLFESHQSSHEILNFKEFALSTIKKFIIDSCFKLITDQRAWICGTGHHYYMKNHNHANSVVSTVFYFQAEGGGDVIFHDPRVNANRGHSSQFSETFQFNDFKFQPKSGDVIVFPSFLYHSVPPYRGKSNRVAIAIDFFANT